MRETINIYSTHSSTKRRQYSDNYYIRDLSFLFPSLVITFFLLWLKKNFFLSYASYRRICEQFTSVKITSLRLFQTKNLVTYSKTNKYFSTRYAGFTANFVYLYKSIT